MALLLSCLVSKTSANTHKVIDVNALANFITIKEFTHCAAFHLATVKAHDLTAIARNTRIKSAGAFIAGALKIDANFTAAALPHSRRYVSALSEGDRVRKYARKCQTIVKDRRFRSRMYDWRYRLNASLPVPTAFFEMEWSGALPPEWYGN